MSRKKSTDAGQPKTPRARTTKPAVARTDWLDSTSDTPVIHEHVQRLESFLQAMADGIVTDKELKDQQARVVELMKQVEPKLKGAIHQDVTVLLCELSAYNIMHTVHGLMGQLSKTKFRG
jgi:hypothetical protein